MKVRLAAAGRPDQEGELAALDRHGGPVEADVAARIDDGHVAQLHGRAATAGAPAALAAGSRISSIAAMSREFWQARS